jgi:Retinal pigment epithelial membrane protein
MTEAVALRLDEPNPYLLGLFAPVRDEITERPLRCVSPKWTQPALRGARALPLVRRRRHGPRDGLRERQAPLASTASCATNQVTGSRTEHRFGPGRFGSEAPFAPREGSRGDDDDGYLVSFVTDERDGRSEVEILDASDIAAGPAARVLLPQRVPLGFHATWVRADQLRHKEM